MTQEHEIFIRIKKLLTAHLSEKIEIVDEDIISVYSDSEEDSPIWIEYNSKEGDLTVGYGISHQHYYPDIDDLNEGFNSFLFLLTCKRQRIDYYKGDFIYKSKYEMEREDGTLKNYGTALTWLFPFWRKTTKRVTYQEPFIDISKISAELQEIKYTMGNNKK